MSYNVLEMNARAKAVSKATEIVTILIRDNYFAFHATPEDIASNPFLENTRWTESEIFLRKVGEEWDEDVWVSTSDGKYRKIYIHINELYVYGEKFTEGEFFIFFKEGSDGNNITKTSGDLKEQVPTNKQNVRPVLFQDLPFPEGSGIWKFIKKFGKEWQDTSSKDVWYIGADGFQFTCRYSGRRGLVIAFYDYPTVEEFQQTYKEVSAAYVAIYFQATIEDVNRGLSGLQIIGFLQKAGLFEQAIA